MASALEDNGDELQGESDLATEAQSEDDFLRELAMAPAMAPPDIRKPGDTIAHYRLGEVLGRGGMGVVYAAEDLRLHRAVALKLLPASAVSDDERRRRFLREARATAAVPHASIAAVFDVGEVEGAVYIAMERVAGRSLRAVIEEARGPLAPEIAARVALDVARGVAAAHAVHIVHRDLKPENVMVRADGGHVSVKVLDFGLAKHESRHRPSRDAETELVTREGRVLGTPAYMSPEQARGRPVDVRSDVFSLGVVLYEMATGRRPFGGGTTMEMLIAVDRDPHPPLRALNPDVPPALARVVDRCLAKSPEARYADAAELATDLERFLAQLPRGRPLSTSAIARWVAVITALGVAGATAALTRPEPSAPTPTASVAAAPRPTAVTDLPRPASTVPEAIDVYMASLQAWRDGNSAAAQEGFERAAKLDPALAVAYLRLALGEDKYVASDVGSKLFQKAVERRTNLPERDRRILEATAPCVQGRPYDDVECGRRFAALAAELPQDAEVQIHLAEALFSTAQWEQGIAAAERALVLDPQFGRAWFDKAQGQSYRGDFAGALQSFDACQRASPAPVVCLFERMFLDRHLGRCAELERDANAVLGIQPNSSVALYVLTEAQWALGQPVPAVEMTLARYVAGLPEAERERFRHALAASIAALQGDLVRAEEQLRASEEVGASDMKRVFHNAAAELRVDLATEAGRVAEAGRIAKAYLDQRTGWTSFPAADDDGIQEDAVSIFLAAERDAGLLGKEAVLRDRDTWVTEWRSKTTSAWVPYLWIFGYPTAVSTPDDAREALDALPRFGGMPPYRRNHWVDTHIGRTFLFAGKIDEAITYLRQSTASCSALRTPVWQTRGYFYLGQALEQKGEKPAACEAYAVVLKRWGNAKPRSVTAEQARARVKVLGCVP